MNINVEDLLTVSGQKYMTLEVLDYESNRYAFVNKLTSNEEPTEEFYVFEDLGGTVKKVVDNKILNILLPKFEKMLVSDIKKISEE